jgi:hypothetical protein
MSTPADITHRIDIAAIRQHNPAHVAKVIAAREANLKAFGFQFTKVTYPNDNADPHAYVQAWLKTPEFPGELDVTAAIDA